MAMLNYAPELRNPKDLGVGGDTHVAAKSLRLAKELIDSMTSDHFSIKAYEDRYRQRVLELISAKRKGKEIIAPEEEPEAPIVNIMEALQKSLHHHASGHSRRPAKHKRRRAG